MKRRYPTVVVAIVLITVLAAAVAVVGVFSAFVGHIHEGALRP